MRADDARHGVRRRHHEVYQAVCLLAEGATPEEVYAARQADARDGADDEETTTAEIAEIAGTGGAAWTAAR